MWIDVRGSGKEQGTDVYIMWRNDMETFSALLAFCDCTPQVTGGFPSQKASDEEIWCFLWCTLETAEETLG